MSDTWKIIIQEEKSLVIYCVAYFVIDLTMLSLSYEQKMGKL